MVEDKLKGEMIDLQHGVAFTRNNCVVNAGTGPTNLYSDEFEFCHFLVFIPAADYSVTAGSKVCIITAGSRQREGEMRMFLELIQNLIGNFHFFFSFAHIFYFFPIKIPSIFSP